MDKLKDKKNRSDFHSTLLRAYADVHIDDIEEGKLTGMVNAEVISNIFKVYLTSPYSSPVKTLNSLLAGIGQVFHLLTISQL